jgi:hypothetical protein
MISYKRQLPFCYLRHLDGSSSDLLKHLPKSERIIWTSSLRLGLLDVFSSMSFEKKDFVLLPAISPQGLVLPLQKKKIEYHSYHLKPGFDVDLDSIKEFISTGRCKVVVFIHYFGLFNPQIYEVKRICVENGVCLFEDFVHGLFGIDDQMRPMGSVGDISFCSLPKFLPVPDGALIFINNDKLKIVLNERKSLLWSFSVFSHTISLLLNNFASKCNRKWAYYLISSLSKLHYVIYYKLLCSMRHNHSVSNTTFNILHHIDIEEFISKRVKIFGLIDEKYKCYHEAFVSPGYPILTLNAQKERSEWKEKGVETLSYIKGWQYVPQSSDYDFERSLQLSHYLLPLKEDILSCL